MPASPEKPLRLVGDGRRGIGDGTGRLRPRRTGTPRRPCSRGRRLGPQRARPRARPHPLRPVYRHWFRAEWEGLEHIPLDGGALLVANHAGAIPSDAPVVMHGIETELLRPVYGLAENLFRPLPVLGTLWSRAGGVPAHPDNAYRLLHDDEQLVLVFPEGTKATGKLVRDRYQLRRFGRGGFVEIAMRAGVPIVPMAIVGNEEAMPILWKSARLAKLLGLPYFPITANQFVFGPLLGYMLPLPAKFRIRVLPPITFDVEPGLDRYNRGMVMEEAERIRIAHPVGGLRHAAQPPQRLARLSADADPRHRARHVLGQPHRAAARAATPTSSSWSASTPANRGCRWSRTEFVQADSSYSILQRIVRATQVDTVLHTHLEVDSTARRAADGCTRST